MNLTALAVLAATCVSTFAELRVVDGEVTSIPSNGSLPDGWARLSGTVLQILGPTEIMLSDRGLEKIVRVKNVPSTDSLYDDAPFYAIAKPDGFYEYKTVLGANSRVFSFDYGRPASKQDEARYWKDLEVRQKAGDDRRKALADSIADEQRKQRETKRQALLTKTVAFQKIQATNGIGYAQYELGRRYLKGEGVETNLGLAKFWLLRAATNGYPGALTNLAAGHR